MKKWFEKFKDWITSFDGMLEIAFYFILFLIFFAGMIVGRFLWK